MVLGEVLRKLRVERELSIKTVAETLNIGVSTLSAYERGFRSPPYETLIQIAGYYNVNIDYLLGLTDISTSWMDLKSYMKLGMVTADFLKSVGRLTYENQKMLNMFTLFLLEQEKNKDN